MNTVSTHLVWQQWILHFNPLLLMEDLTKTRRLQNKKSQTKPKGVTSQMKALGEYILMVLFVLLLKRVHFLVNKT